MGADAGIPRRRPSAGWELDGNLIFAEIRRAAQSTPTPLPRPLVHAFTEWQDWSESVAGRRLRYFIENLLQNYLAIFP